MTIPTEPIGSIPRPRALIEGIGAFAAGRLPQPELDRLYEAAIADTIKVRARIDGTVLSARSLEIA